MKSSRIKYLYIQLPARRFEGDEISARTRVLDNVVDRSAALPRDTQESAFFDGRRTDVRLSRRCHLMRAMLNYLVETVEIGDVPTFRRRITGACERRVHEHEANATVAGTRSEVQRGLREHCAIRAAIEIAGTFAAGAVVTVKMELCLCDTSPRTMLSTCRYRWFP